MNNPKAECDNNGNFIEVINDCYWKGACDVCRLMVLPCQRVIESGECDALKEFFKSNNQ